MLAQIRNPLLPSVYDVVWAFVVIMGVLLAVAAIIAVVTVLRRRRK